MKLLLQLLTYQDLNDFYKEETKGYNFGTSAGADKTDQNKTNLHPQGSTTIGLTHTGQERTDYKSNNRIGKYNYCK